MDVALIHAKENAGNLSPKYKECLEIADRALADRALAEEVSREPMGLSTGKSAKEIGAMVVAGMNDMHTWPDAFLKWAKGCAGKGDAGLKEALGAVVQDSFNTRGIQFIRDELGRK